MSIPTWPCCEHCQPEPNGKRWASEVGHGCSCLECPPTNALAAGPQPTKETNA